MDVEAPVLERVLRRDRHIVIGGLVFVALACWLYILLGAGMDSAPTAPRLAMWLVMMVAMMLPSAAPLVLLFATVNRKTRERGQPYVPTGVFAAGYLIPSGDD